MKFFRQITQNFDQIDFSLAPSIYFVTLCLIYILFFLDIPFKLKFLKGKCFQTIVDNRKTRCVLSRCFLEVFFYLLKLYFKFLTCVVYALVGVSSLLLFVVKINQSRKLLKVIFFTYTLQSGIEEGLYYFLGGRVDFEKQLKVN